jgi:hypothetical protein
MAKKWALFQNGNQFAIMDSDSLLEYIIKGRWNVRVSTSHSILLTEPNRPPVRASMTNG